MTWNYRIVKIGEEFGIYEVFYDDQEKPAGYTSVAVSPKGENLEDFHEDFLRYKEAINDRVLTVTKSNKLVEWQDEENS